MNLEMTKLKSSLNASFGRAAAMIYSYIIAVDLRFKPQRVIGIGAYGIVCAAKDELTQHMVAIKKVRTCR